MVILPSETILLHRRHFGVTISKRLERRKKDILISISQVYEQNAKMRWEKMYGKKTVAEAFSHHMP